ncbi:glutamate 5-kinase [Marinoscillum sp. MHG1-6]|uniref:glutamate 5-kinase n=1 Tax=Marinoscillum sp. MHG1-6 TaxID=2959627 RepID=UPI002157C8F0|nr:glutamate 5-kinase [Marinoscillum sp. MHG1-6]
MKKEKRIVVKVGTNVLTKHDGTLDKPIFRQVVVQLARLKEMGWSPILVSSGAVGAGRSIIGDCDIQDEAIRRQVLSSVGQASLMKRYYELFHEYDIVCSQVLATKEDFATGDHYQNMINCFEGLLGQGIVPIVNENDVVSLVELMFTDNDELAGLTAQMVEAEKLIILSNIDGLFTGMPGEDGSELVKEVGLNDQAAKTFVSSNKSGQGRGGMESKLKVACEAAAKGIETFIANGKRDHVVIDIVNGKQIGTRFLIGETVNEK